MNVNELADLIEFDAPVMGINKEAATILRRQADRIAELEKDLKYFTNPCDPMCKPSICDCYKARFAINNRKTLTDEVQEVLVDVIRLLESQRIWNGMDWHYNLIPPFSYLPVAEKVKAILKKASEK